MAQSLTYSLLEDLEFACDGGPPVALSKIDAIAKSLGPVIQLERSSCRGRIADWASVEFRDFEPARDFVRRPSGLYFGRGGTIGIAAASSNGEAALELMQRGLAAINKSSLPSAAAAQAVSALGEFESNIGQHANDPEMGIVAYEVNSTFLGLYSSDLGQGILSSLRKNPTYAMLDDEGEALKLALQEGVSSSTEPGRGKGFRPIFVGLASHWGLLKFRSGDSLLELSGFTGRRPRPEIKERSRVAGFHVSVHCRFVS